MDLEAASKEIGDLLGLYRGSEGQPVRPAADNSLARQPAILTEAAKHNQQADITIRIAADYFPSLVRAVTSQLEDRTYPRLDALLGEGFSWLAQTVAIGGFPSRFVREFPDEARKLLVNIIACLAYMGQMPEEVFVAVIKLPDFLSKVAGSFLNLLIANALSPSTSPPLSLDTQTRSRIKITLDRLKKNVPSFYGAEAIERLAESENAMNLHESRKDTLRMGPCRWEWWSCEAMANETNKTGCARLEKGQELAACSRCHMVRYCSPAHQKADWKRHKSSCVKPSW